MDPDIFLLSGQFRLGRDEVRGYVYCRPSIFRTKFCDRIQVGYRFLGRYLVFSQNYHYRLIKNKCLGSVFNITNLVMFVFIGNNGKTIVTSVRGGASQMYGNINTVSI